ncbi:coiled-coil domain-containing protein 112 isoform X1 [Notechis scutatus]|uniref:Coiled-coil domain-containing protein 112 isoform X1 n=1 Tax=Notechis scutatus TaxID=8663 RepID=A0A6J1U8G2_9SAUR|nr:coiled-coil domain-containing protein 112 isoform X1 [Notechis scutatus]
MAALATPALEGWTRYQQNGSCFSAPDALQHFQSWKTKTDQVKKIEFIRTGNKLKNQLVNLQKHKNVIFNKKSDFTMEYCILEELEHKLTKNRKTEKAKIQQKLTRIHSAVKGLQRQLKDVKPTPEFVDKLREMMEEAEAAISSFKEEQRQIYDELLREENAATNEISALERKIEMWAVGTSAARIFKQCVFPVHKEVQNQFPEEVIELERFLQQTGGRQGGWDQCDHQIFLRIWRKHKGKPSYITETLEHLPDRTKEDIQSHEKWHKEFLILESQKKEAIQKWKMKKREKSKILVQKENPEEVPTDTQREREETQKQKTEEERKKRLAELEAWKKDKALATAAKQEAQLKEEEEKEKKKQRERQRQLQMKLLLEDYSREKKEQEELLRFEKEKREEAEREEKKRTAAEEIVKFQERDLHKLELKVLEKQAKEDEKIEKEKRLSKLKKKVHINVTRDPCRLFRPTKVWEERTKEIGPVGTGPVLYIPHRAVPSWRQGL